MKKFVSLALALVMVLALGVIASAATYTSLQDDTHSITATYVAGSEGKAFSVTVEWTDPTFVYTNGAKSWDAEDHVWVDNAEEGTWTTSTAGSVTVTNDSSVGVTATVSIVSGDEYIKLGETTTKALAAGVANEDGDSFTVAISLESDAPAIDASESPVTIASVKVALAETAQ